MPAHLAEEVKPGLGYRLLPPLILAVVPALLYGQTMGHEFVWDDVVIHVTNNPFLNPPSLENLAHFWREAYEGLYIPVSYTIWGLLKNISGSPGSGHPFVFHLANLILHTINGLLVYLLLRLLIKSRAATLAAALVFVVHPIQVESAALISEMRGLLAAALGFSALYLYLRGCAAAAAHKGEGSRWAFRLHLLLGWSLFVLALLSKPSAAVVPIFAALMERHLHRTPVKQIALRLAPWLAATLALLIITRMVQVYDPFVSVAPLWARPLIWMDAASFYLYKVLFPLLLTVSYGRTPEFLMGQWWFYVLWVVPVLVGICLWLIRKRQPLLALSALLFMAGFLPVSGLVAFTFQEWSTVADRYLYLSMLGVALAFATLASSLRQRLRWVVIITLLVFWAGWSTFVQIPVFQDTLSLWNHCLRITPNEPHALNNRGIIRGSRGQFKEAIKDFDRSIAVLPTYADPYNNRAVAHFYLKDYQSALSDVRQAQRLGAPVKQKFLEELEAALRK